MVRCRNNQSPSRRGCCKWVPARCSSRRQIMVTIRKTQHVELVQNLEPHSVPWFQSLSQNAIDRWKIMTICIYSFFFPFSFPRRGEDGPQSQLRSLLWLRHDLGSSQDGSQPPLAPGWGRGRHQERCQVLRLWTWNHILMEGFPQKEWYFPKRNSPEVNESGSCHHVHFRIL